MASAPPDPSTDAVHAPLDERDALPAGTRFGELEVLRVLGVGGFGIVYLCQDHALERPVALKEYMPSSLAGRGKGLAVSIRSGAHTATYALGLRSFVNEARLLARFNHPSLVKVYRFWEENGTAYMVMPYLQGRTLRDVRRSMTAAPSEAWMRTVLGPVLDALEQLHREDVYHRDIAPDNILLPPGELPVLLDFGAARRAIGDRTQTFTAILKPSYAPIEQYAEVVQLRQGPWTDLYALGAVAYYLLHGTPPPPATARAVQEDLPLLASGNFPDVSPQFIDAVEWALAVRPADRPQNIAALREVLDGRCAVPPRSRGGSTAAQAAMAAMQAGPAFATTVRMDPVTREAAIEPTRPPTASPRTVPAASKPSTLPPREPTTTMPGMATLDTPQPSRRRGMGVGWLAAAFGGLVVVAAAAAWMIGRAPAPAEAPKVAAPAAPGPAAAVTQAAPAPAPEAASKVVAATPAPRGQPPRIASRGTEDLPAPSPAVTPAPPATPHEACGSRVFLALALCMEQQCERPRFRAHPQCRQVLETLERRRRGESG